MYRQHRAAGFKLVLLGHLMAMSFALQANQVKEPINSANTTLEVGRSQEVKLDIPGLFLLKPGQVIKLDLGGAGKQLWVFEHVTSQYNNTTFWEAHLQGDTSQRLSFKQTRTGTTGSINLQNKRYWISQVQGKFILTRMSDNYTPPQHNQAGVQVFKPSGSHTPMAKVIDERPSDLPAMGSYPVDLNMAQLRAMPLNSEVELNLPDGRSVSLVHDNGTLSPSGNYNFIGYVRDKGTDYRVILTTGSQGETFGVLNLPEGEVRVETRKGQTWLVDTKKAGLTYSPMAEPLLPPSEKVASYQAKAPSTIQSSQPSSTPKVAMAPGDTVIDLMVVYTPGMVNRLGGDGPARTRIDNLVAVTNQIMIDSQVQVQMRLVKALYVNQDDNVNQGTLLSALSRGQGAFSGVKAARDAAGADLVHLLHKPTVGVGSCGIAYLSVTQGPRGNEGSGYGVTDDSCPTMVMAHELGHNFGNNHDHAQGGGNPVYPYAWGYIVPGTSLGDVMSYANQHYYKYSNPRIGGCNNQACGQNDYADASRAINQVKDIVAGYRATQNNGGGTGGGTTPASNQVCFYGDINYAGSAGCLGEGSFNTSNSFNDVISSVRIPKGLKVELFEHGGFGGRTLTLLADEPNLVSRNFNDLTSSFRISRSGIANGRYRLVATHSGKCMDVAWASTAEGADIAQVACNGNTAQTFDVIHTGNGFYKLININSGKAVDVANSSTADGANIRQWSDNGTSAQRYAIQPSVNGGYMLVNQNSGKCADVAGWSSGDGADILQWSCHGGANQSFRFEPR